MPRKTSVAKDQDTDKPWIHNYPPLRDWLNKHEARCNWQIPLGDPDRPNAYVESWTFAGATGEVIIVVLANQNGWNLYTPHTGNKIDDSLIDAEHRLGLAAR